MDGWMDGWMDGCVFAILSFSLRYALCPLLIGLVLCLDLPGRGWERNDNDDDDNKQQQQQQQHQRTRDRLINPSPAARASQRMLYGSRFVFFLFCFALLFLRWWWSSSSWLLDCLDSFRSQSTRSAS